ncbi:tetratricopeptide repeat protein 31 isoform X3 [Eublepharis macularius]|uniref:Tetratricopeptide repeat protein 31 isoform X3 n=1 Tax=Eublepharis macularius TaxID=481883 RepID=A0AA97JW12_EUBMA|nr:tetratricopeptide repeat protein 31 isoform X3 [Eublepharis macularius]
MDGLGYLYYEDETDDSFSCDDWEAHSEPEEEEEAAQSAGPATFCGLKKAFLCKPSAPSLLASGSPDASLLSFVLPQKQRVTAEEAERNAKELVAEEERVKKKAEKKRLKKKRQKDRKRQEKRNQELEAKGQAQPAKPSDRKEGASLADVLSVLRSGPPEPEDGSARDPSKSQTSPGCSTEEEEEEELEEELDLTSSFVSKARLKVSTRPPLRKEKTARPQQVEQEKVPRPGPKKTPVEQSMVLADCGNETAERGCYWEAVLLFTEAVKLNPKEYRFFGNRSFCYEKLQCYPEALRDARLALRLQPGWPKGLFRQGKALMGLKQYADAARTFEELLQLDGLRGDAAMQLQQCHAQLLQLCSTCCCCCSLPSSASCVERPSQGKPAAFAWRLASSEPQPPGGDASGFPHHHQFKVPPGATAIGCSSPSQGVVCCLGGEPHAQGQPGGPLALLPAKFCAFINYVHQDAAEAAYVALQGVEVEGSTLLLQLKHPVHATPPAAKAPSGTQRPLQREQARPPSPWAVPGRIPVVPKGTSAVLDTSPRGELRQKSCSCSELKS